MRSAISRWFLFGLLLGWSLTHASVFGQVVGQPAGVAQPGIAQPGLPQPGGGVKFTPMAPDKIRQGLDKVITVDYTAQSLSDAINHLRDRTGLPITLDQMVILQMGVNPDDNSGALQVKATKEKASQVLRRTLDAYRLCFIIIDGTILVTTEETAVFRQMRQRVSVDLDNVPLQKAARDLAKAHGLNLVIDPKVLKQSETPVTLQLENAGIETTVRLLAELGSLKAVRMGNVMFITNEDKAKKIREEEKDQFDNPLNPNVPLMVPGIRGGGFGGPIAMPAILGGIGPGIPVDPNVIPPPPPGIELPPAKVVPEKADPPVKKQIIEIRPNGSTTPVAPPAPPAVDRPPAPPALPPRQEK